MKNDLEVYEFESGNSVSLGKVEIRHRVITNLDEDCFLMDENDSLVATYSGHSDKQL